MATTTIDTAAALAPNIQATLDALRRRIRAYVLVEGIGLALLWLGFAFWASLAIDWFFEPPPAVRAVILGVAAIGALGIVYRMVLSRLFVRLSDSSMATVLERRFASLDDALLTAVLLTEQHIDPEQCNPAMLARTCREAAERIGGVRVPSVFNAQPLRRAVGGAMLFAASVALFGFVAPEALDIWARRNLLFASDLWPRQSRFIEIVGVRDGEEVRFVDGVLKVARGGELTLLARADTQAQRVPASVEIRYRAEGGPRQRKLMAREGSATAKDAYQEYSYRFEGVLAPIHFDVLDAGPSGDRLRDYRIEVVESPTLSETFLDCEYPVYTGRTSRTLAVSGVMALPLGTKVTVRAQANKPLVRVQVDAAQGEQRAETDVLEGDALADGGRSFAYTIPALTADTTLLFTLADVDGIRSREPFRLLLAGQADEPPQLRLRLDGIGTAVTPEARVPFVGQISDDYGIARVWAETTIDQQDASEHALATLDRHPSEYEVKDLALEVRELALMPGQKVQLSVRAADRYDLGGAGPNVGQSERWLLEIVTPEQLRAMLEARELVLRQRFEVIINEVTETRDLLLKVTFRPEEEIKPEDKTAKEPEDGEPKKSTAAPGEEPDDAPREDERQMTPEKHRALQVMRVQRALQNARKNAHEVKGVAESFDDIRKQLINNRIDTEELKLRLESGIARPLHAIADEMFPALEQRLERLQESLGDMERGPPLRQRAQKQADEILTAMLRVRDKMIELEDFNEAVEMLRQIIKLQELLDEATKQRHKQTIRNLMED